MLSLIKQMTTVVQKVIEGRHYHKTIKTIPASYTGLAPGKSITFKLLLFNF